MDCVLLQRAPSETSGRFKCQQLWSDRVQVQELHFGVRSRGGPLSCRNSRVSYDRLIRFVPLCSQNGAGIATEVDSADNAFLQSEIGASLEAKGKELFKDLKGRSIYLIGMMGSGKTTVGELVGDAVGYCFFDSDQVIEESGGATVAEIFQQGDEEDFRNAESEVLQQLSLMPRLVIATGGGAVVRPQNWGCLHTGIVVYLDVPLEALAKRVVAAGTEKRPLLAQHAAVTYEEALARLKELYEQRGKAYANADVTVSVQEIAKDMGLESCDKLSPDIIALKVIEQVHDLIKSYKHYKKPRVGIL